MPRKGKKVNPTTSLSESVEGTETKRSGQGSQHGTMKEFYEIASVINVPEVKNSIVIALRASSDEESSSGRLLQ